MLFDIWFVLGFYGAIAAIPVAAVGLLLCAAQPAWNRAHPGVRRALWAVLLAFTVLAVSLGAFVVLTVD